MHPSVYASDTPQVQAALQDNPHIEKEIVQLLLWISMLTYPYPHVFTGLVNFERVGHGDKFHSAGTVHFNQTVKFHCTGVVQINQHMVLRRFTFTEFMQAASYSSNPSCPSTG